MKTTEQRLRASIRRMLKEYYDDYDDGGGSADNSARYLDFDPIVIEIPAFAEVFPEELQDSPDGQGFSDGFAFSIAEALEGGEPDIEDYDYDDQDEDYVKAKKIYDAASDAGIDNNSLATNIRDAVQQAKDAGYEY